MVARPADGEQRAAHARVERLLRQHRAVLLGIARRWTGSTDEAEDALQRALEIYVRRLTTLDPATELGWMKVVVRHEAMALGRARSANAGASLDENELADRLPASELGVHERIERDFRVARSLEALAQLKPDERTALLLKAEGFSYREIGERQGWTYTKTNRAITEGRRRFMAIFARIESGEECERFAPTLRALVQGQAAAADVVALRPHLRHCSACRAAMRGLHSSLRHRLVLHLPLAAGVAPVRWLGERVAREPAADVERGASVKHAFHGLVGRFTSPDVAAGVQLGSSGGGRGPAVAALLSLCLGGGAGTYCVAGGVLPDPTRLVRHSDEQREARSKREERERQAREARAARARATPEPVVVAEPPPLVTRSVAAASTASAGTESQRAAGKAEPKRKAKRRASASADGEFGFEGTTGSPGAVSEPTSAPATATTAAAVGSGSSGGGGGGSAGGSTSSVPPPTSGGEFFP